MARHAHVPVAHRRRPPGGPLVAAARGPEQQQEAERCLRRPELNPAQHVRARSRRGAAPLAPLTDRPVPCLLPSTRTDAKSIEPLTF